jgi:hypothetical protein
VRTVDVVHGTPPVADVPDGDPVLVGIPPLEDVPEGLPELVATLLDEDTSVLEDSSELESEVGLAVVLEFV